MRLIWMTEKDMYEFFKAQGMNDYGVSGLLGNLFSESGLRVNNLQNSYEKKLNITDEEYRGWWTVTIIPIL